MTIRSKFLILFETKACNIISQMQNLYYHIFEFEIVLLCMTQLRRFFKLINVDHHQKGHFFRVLNLNKNIL